jgi:hypothetical protein
MLDKYETRRRGSKELKKLNVFSAKEVGCILILFYVHLSSSMHRY